MFPPGAGPDARPTPSPGLRKGRRAAVSPEDGLRPRDAVQRLGPRETVVEPSCAYGGTRARRARTQTGSQVS